MDVPVQFFQSAIAIELAVAGALLWQIRFFEPRDARRRESESLPDARLRVGLALVMGATLFGSLWAIADEGPKWAALAVTVGLATSHVPIGRLSLRGSSMSAGHVMTWRFVSRRCVEL